MKDIFLHAQKHELIPEGCNPLEKVRVKASNSGFVPIILTPKETFAIFNQLPLHQQTMVLLDAATGLRYSEIAGLQWRDVDWENKRIQIEKRWIRCNVDGPKTRASKAPVVMSDVLAAYLMAWRRETKYAKEEDWVFASEAPDQRATPFSWFDRLAALASALTRTRVRRPVLGTCSSRVTCTRLRSKPGSKETILRMKNHGKEGGQEREIEKKIYFDKKGERVRRFGFHQFRLVDTKAGFRSLTEAIDTTTPARRMMMQMVGAFAEFERAMLRERTKAGLDAAGRDGRIGGRPPKLSTQQQEEIQKMVLRGEKTAADAARLFKIHPSTVSRLLSRTSLEPHAKYRAKSYAK